jgi:mRNA-degrading endonuclease RelE of RelBE toxin-antitoxin system
VSTCIWVWLPPFCEIFDDLDFSVQERIEDKLEEIASALEFYPHKSLSHHKNTYKVRVGDYRVIYGYKLNPNQELILLAVDHRSKVYKDFSRS